MQVPISDTLLRYACLQAQRAAKQAEAVAARRAQATAWKACAPERAAAAEKAAAAQKAAVEKAATRKAAAAAKAAQHVARAVSERAQPTAARSPTTSLSESEFSTHMRMTLPDLRPPELHADASVTCLFRGRPQRQQVAVVQVPIHKRGVLLGISHSAVVAENLQ